MIWILLKLHGLTQAYWDRIRRSNAVDAHIILLSEWVAESFKVLGVTVDEAKKRPLFWKPSTFLVLAVTVVFVSWGAVLLFGVFNWVGSAESRAQFGEAFGVVSALF